MNIKELRIELKLTQKQMAESMGIERTLYTNIELGKNKLTAEQIRNVIKKHNVNPEWILFGTSEMFSFKNDAKEETADKTAYKSADKTAYKLSLTTNNGELEEESVNESVKFSEKSVNEVVNKLSLTTKKEEQKASWFMANPNIVNTDIHRVGAKMLQDIHNKGLSRTKVYMSLEPAMAGYPSSYITEGDGEVEHFYMPFLNPKGVYACFQVRGRSMEEYIKQGSYVICRLLEEESQVRSGNLHLVATQTEGVLLKRVRIEKKATNGIILYSDNPNYIPFIMPHEDILRIWAVELFIQEDFGVVSTEVTENLNNFIANL